MSDFGPPGNYGPPNQPPYGPPPYGGPPAPSGSSSATVVTAVLAAVFVVAAALVGWAVNDQDSDRSTASGPVSASSGVPLPGTTSVGGAGVPGAGGQSPNGSATSALPSATSSSYVPPTPPSPTRVPLNPETINKTFQLYMQALLNRSLSQLKSATCPKLRHTETGTALDGKYINRWKGHRYTIYNSLDYVIIAATVRYVNPNTGGNGGTHVYSWYVTRYPNGRYWVCGFRG